jgi:adenine-specific DNA-methyltransferase
MIQSLPMHTPDGTAANIAAIAAAFPHCITESRSATGEVVKAVDFDLLRQELSAAIVEGPQERYQLNWPGKRDALLAANAPIAKTLRPDRAGSVAFDTTQNLYIEGDNLDALKLLQETYLGAVKMIYIDPPYNTGHDFVYNDDFAEDSGEYLRRSQQVSEAGERMVANLDSNGRFHSDWLSMMYPRLKLARNLLKEDGVIFISIDDNEQANLERICKEVLGAENFVAQLVWKSRQIVDSRNQNNASSDHELILVFCKNKEIFSLRGKEIQENKYSNPDNDARGAWMSNSMLGLANASQRPNLHYQITDPVTGWIYDCPADSGWRYSKANMQTKIIEGRVVFPKLPTGRPREKKFIAELASNFTGLSSILPPTVGFTLNGSRELRDLFDDKYFDFPKPVSLIQTLLQQGSDDDSIILDFFSGSATTAHAVMQLNAEDGGNRRFILVQLPEVCAADSEAAKAGYATIAEIGKERIRRAGAKIATQAAAKLDAKPLDTGFRVLKVDTSNMADVYYTPDTTTQAQLATLASNIKLDRSAEDLLFQVMLDWGVDLAAPIRSTVLAGKTVWAVTEPSGASLLACFDDAGGINDALVRALAEQRPDKVVFRDAGFANDSVKINVEQLFKALSPTTEIRVL